MTDYGDYGRPEMEGGRERVSVSRLYGAAPIALAHQKVGGEVSSSVTLHGYNRCKISDMSYENKAG